jgi:hypothetical protein
MRPPTSITKFLRGLYQEKNALDEQESVKEPFDDASEGNKGANAPKPKAPELSGSRMVRDHAPTPGLRPTGYLRQVPDKFAAARKLEAEHKEAEARNRTAEMTTTAKMLADRRDDRETDNSFKDTESVFGNPTEQLEQVTEKPADDEAIRDAWAQFNERQAELEAHDREQEREWER